MKNNPILTFKFSDIKDIVKQLEEILLDEKFSSNKELIFLKLEKIKKQVKEMETKILKDCKYSFTISIEKPNE